MKIQTDIKAGYSASELALAGPDHPVFLPELIERHSPKESFVRVQFKTGAAVAAILE